MVTFVALILYKNLLMINIKRSFLLLYLTFAFLTSFSQSRFFGTVGTGIIYYNGDLNDKRIIPPSKIFNAHYTAGIGYNIDGIFDVRLQYLHGNIEGADSISNEYDNKVRNLSFKSKIDEVTITAHIKFFKLHKKKLFNPYVFGGIGMFWFNPTAELNGTTYELQPIGTEGQYLGGNYPSPYKLRQRVIPLGLGVNINLNSNWKLKVEFAEHFTSTDYLDDASSRYPDSSLLAAVGGPVAIALSNRRIDTKGFFPVGRSRANTKKNDNYVRFTVGLIYNPRRKKSSEFGRVGIFRKFFKGKGSWWGGKGKGL